MNKVMSHRGRVLNTLLSILLALTMVIGSVVVVPQTAYAVQLDYRTVKVGAINRYDDQSIQDVSVEFTWPSVPCEVYLVLLDKKIGNGNDLYHTYHKKWPTYDESLVGIGTVANVVSASNANDPKVIEYQGAKVSHTFTFNKGQVDTNKDATFYAYVWTYYEDSYYPDAFIVSIDIENGVISTSTDYDSNRQHKHSWEFTANGNTITAKCTSRVGRPCQYSRDGLKLTVNANDADYTGSPYNGYNIDDKINDVINATKTITFEGTGGTSYSESTTAPTEPGTYTIKVRMGSGSGAATATANFAIGKKSVNPTLSIKNAWTIGEDPELSVANSGEGTVTYYVKAQGAGDDTYVVKTADEVKALGAGAYTIKAHVDGTATTNEANTTEVNFTVNKKTITPTVSLNSWMRGDTNIPSPTVTGNEGDGTVTYYVKGEGDADYREISETDLKNLAAGSYTLKASIAATDTTEAAETAETTFTVSKGTTSADFSMTGWNYGEYSETTNGPKVTNAVTGDATATIMYKKAGESDDAYRTMTAEELKALPAGNYVARYQITTTDNYEGLTKEVPFTIAKKPITVTASITGWTYGDEPNSPSIGENDNPGNGTVTYTYYTDEACTQAVNGVPTAAGTYYVKASVAETTNYASATSAPVEFQIAKKQVTAVVSAETRTYDGTTDVTVTAEVKDGIVAGDSVKISGLTGSIENKNAGEDKKVTVDKTNVKVKGTGSENYEIVYDIDGNAGKALTVTIDRKEVTLSWIDTDGETDHEMYYNAQSQGVNASVVGALEGDTVDVVYASDDTHRAVKAGSYTAEVSDVTESSTVAATRMVAVKNLGNSNYTLAKDAQTTCPWKIIYKKAGDATVSGKEGNDGWYVGKVTVTPPAGYQISTKDSADDADWKDELTFKEDGEQTVTYYLRDKDGNITEAKTVTFKIDQTNPDGDIQANESSVKTALNTITFGKLFKDNVKVTITGEDATSGVAKIEYQKVASADAYDEKGEWTTLETKNGKGSFNIAAEDKCVIYARITDNAGNVTIINSDGLVIYKEPAKETENKKDSSSSKSSKDSGSSHKRHEGGYGNVTLYNVAAADGKFLAGAQFALYKSNDEYIGTYTVDKNGMITLENIAASTYYFKQVKAADGYAMTYDPIRFALEDDQIIGIKVSSQLIAAATTTAQQTAATTVTNTVVPSEDGAAQAATTANGKAVVNTGDESHMMLYGATAAVAAVLLAAWFVMNKRVNK